MFTRDLPGITLTDLPSLVRTSDRTWSGSTADIRVSLDTEGERPNILLGNEQVPATWDGIEALGGFFEVPTKFLARIQPDEQQFILEHRIARSKEEHVQVTFNEQGLVEMFKGSQIRLPVHDIVEQLFDVLPAETEVVEWWANSEDLRIDLIVPEGYDRGVGGEVGDITRGGIRVGQNRKQNLAPWVQPYMFRLRCTNGFEVYDPGLRVDARGVDDSEILSLLKGECRRAFDRVEHDIKAFYDLRTQKVDEDRTGMFRRIAHEQGLPERTIGRLEDTLPEVIGGDEVVTLFHFANHITNAANDPHLAHRPNVRRSLEQAGGRMVADHAARCAVCHARLMN